jgi:uncharacterized iron-regulated membrane protein
VSQIVSRPTYSFGTPALVKEVLGAALGRKTVLLVAGVVIWLPAKRNSGIIGLPFSSTRKENKQFSM